MNRIIRRVEVVVKRAFLLECRFRRCAIPKLETLVLANVVLESVIQITVATTNAADDECVVIWVSVPQGIGARRFSGDNFIDLFSGENEGFA